MSMLFQPGRILPTPAALDALHHDSRTLATLLARHLAGDWGDLDADDWRANVDALRDGHRLLSAYTLADGTPIWILTEADRSRTCVLLPSEY